MRTRYLFSLQDNGFIKQFKKHWWHRWHNCGQYRGNYSVYQYSELPEKAKIKYPIKPLYKAGDYAVYAPQCINAQKSIKFYIKGIRWNSSNSEYVYTLVYHNKDIEVSETHLYLCKYKGADFLNM